MIDDESTTQHDAERLPLRRANARRHTATLGAGPSRADTRGCAAAVRGSSASGAQATSTSTGVLTGTQGSKASCAQQAAWGKCNESFMADACDDTCGRCVVVTNATGAFSLRRGTPVSWCTDAPPLGQFTCAQQAAWKKCDTLGDACDASCGRCKGVAFRLSVRAATVVGINASQLDAEALGRGLMRAAYVTVGAPGTSDKDLRVVVHRPASQSNKDAGAPAPRTSVGANPVVVSFDIYFTTKGDADRFAAKLAPAIDAALAAGANESPKMRNAHLLAVGEAPAVVSVAGAPAAAPVPASPPGPHSWKPPPSSKSWKERLRDWRATVGLALGPG